MDLKQFWNILSHVPFTLKTALANTKAISPAASRVLFAPCKVQGNKLAYVSVATLLNNKFLVAGTNKTTLKTRFFEASSSSDPDLYGITFAGKTVPLPARLKLAHDFLYNNSKTAFIEDKKSFKYNSTHDWVETSNLDALLAIRSLCFPTEDVKQELIDLYNQSNSDYHTGQAQSKLADEDFDRLKDWLLQKKWIKANKVGAKETGRLPKIELHSPMGSLEKITSKEEFLAWYKKYAPSYNENIIITPKIDGISAQLRYTKGLLDFSARRGDGVEGTNILRHAKECPAIPKKLKKSTDKLVRVELFIENSTFESKYLDKPIDGKVYKNTRNMAAGITNRGTADPKLLKDVKLFAYDGYSKGWKSEELKELKALGFNVVPFVETAPTSVEHFPKMLEKFRAELDVEIDGLVVEFNNPKLRRGTETNSLNPAFARAYKLSKDEAKETKVIRVEWNASRTGALKPTVIVQPVSLSGVTVKQATGHNAANIRDNKIGPGAVIKIQRSGDTIPYILSVTKGTAPQFPDKKQVGDYNWNTTQIDLILADSSNSIQSSIESLTHFFNELGVEGFKQGTAQKFYDAGYKTPVQILRLNSSQIVENVEGFQSRGAEKLHAEFEKLRDPGVSLPALLYASNLFGRGFGLTKAKEIYKAFGKEGILTWNSSSVQLAKKLADLPGFSLESATEFCKRIDSFKAFAKQLNGLINIKQASSAGSVLKGKIIAQTGFRLTKTETEQVESLGGQIVSSVSSKVNLLLVAKKGSGSDKENKANDLGIEIMEGAAFKAKYLKG